MHELSQDTHEQKIARALDRHISLTANAGSGKTRVLVNRYLDIIFKKNIIDPPKNYYRDNPTDDIVAITFTRKASSEMLSKAIAKLDDIYNQSNSLDTREKIYIIRQGLTQARVSTIHSFCADIIRSYPVEAGITPAFYELEPAEVYEILDTAIISVIEDYLDFENPHQELLIELINMYGKNKIQNFIAKIIQKLGLLENLLQFYEKSNEEILEFYDYQISNTVSLAIEIAYNFLKEFNKVDFETDIQKKDRKKFLDALNSVNDFDISKFEDTNNLLTKFSEIKGHFYRSDNELRKPFSYLAPIVHLENRVPTIKHNLTIALKFEEAYKYEKYNGTLIDYARVILELAKDVKSLIWDIKTELGGIDFNDMIEITNRLLDNPNILKAVKSRIKYLLIDEFQDTDPVQYKIITKLVPELKDQDISYSDTNLFIVGDAKQSIYAFRDADVRVFEQAKKDIARVNMQRIVKKEINRDIQIKNEIFTDLEDDVIYGNMKLTASFRLLPDISAFVNIVCEHIFNQNRTEYDVDYDRLVCVRNADKILNNERDRTTTGSVNFVFSYKTTIPVELSEEDNFIIEEDSSTDPEEEIQPEIDSVIEAKTITKLIKHILNSEEYLVEDKDGTLRKPELNDIAVLSRKNKTFTNLITELAKAKIPYVLNSGGDFYNTQEIVDLIALFNFLNNYKDDISLLIILRSPFFNIDNNSLLKINCGEEPSLWEKLLAYSDQNEDDFEVKRAKDILNELLSELHHLTFPEVVIKLINDCDYFTIISNRPNFKQIEANINKFLEIARDFETRGFKSISDFANYLNFVRETTTLEPLAQFEIVSGAINLFSIHSAKGLEFPIVILYNTNSITRSTEELYALMDLGLSFKIKKLQDNAILNITTPIHQFLKKKKKEIDTAEEKRILYVAMTRAKDHLFISSCLKVQKDDIVYKPKGLCKFIFDGLGISPNIIKDDKYYLACTNLELLYEDKIQTIKDYEFEIGIIKDEDLQEYETQQIEIEKPLFTPLVLLEPHKLYMDREIFSATKTLLFKERIDEFVKRYILGLPTEDDPELCSIMPIADLYEDDVIGTLAGSIIHKVLEKISVWLTKDEKKTSKLLKDVIKNEIDNANRKIPQNMKERIYRECFNIYKTKLVQSNFDALLQAQTEYDLSLPLVSNVLNGKIDLVLQKSNKQVEVWDWKTNKVDNNTRPIIAQKFEWQLKIYAFLIHYYYPEQNEITARLLFTRLAQPDANDEQWTNTFRWSYEELSNFRNDIIDVIKKINKYSYRIE